MRIGINRFDSEDFFKARNRFLISLLHLVKDAEVILGVSQIGIDIAGTFEEDNCRLGAALLVRGQSQIVKTYGPRIWCVRASGSCGAAGRWIRTLSHRHLRKQYRSG